jgi:glycosyltransferase involved in cell wall biosynthesis
MQLSIIIPTLNEQRHIGRLLDHLYTYADERLREIIVADGGSVDQTQNIVETTQAQLIRCNQKGRAHQMNQGARESTGDVLYFIHADTIPPASYMDDIENAILAGKQIGGYRFRFDSDRFDCI